MAATAGLASTTFIASGLFDDVGVIADEARIVQETENNPRRGPVNVSIPTVVISAFVFITILSWFEFLREWYDYTFIIRDRNKRNNEPDEGLAIVFSKFWFAIFITAMALVGIRVIYVVFPDKNPSS